MTPTHSGVGGFELNNGRIIWDVLHSRSKIVNWNVMGFKGVPITRRQPKAWVEKVIYLSAFDLAEHMLGSVLHAGIWKITQPYCVGLCLMLIPNPRFEHVWFLWFKYITLVPLLASCLTNTMSLIHVAYL